MGKKKPKLINFISEPAVQSQLVCLNDDDSAALKQAFGDLVDKDPSLAFPKKERSRPFGRKSASAGDEVENKPIEMSHGNASTSKLKQELFFGINEIIRSIEKRLCLGVILTNPLTTHLQLTVSELCKEAEIACLCVNGFHELRSVLNISSLTGISFKNSVQNDTALCSKVFELFTSLAKCAKPIAPDTRVQVPDSTITASDLDACCHAIMKIDRNDKLTFITPSFEELYILKAERKVDGSESDKEDGADDESFLRVQEDEHIFPNRAISGIDSLVIKVKNFDQDDNFSINLLKSTADGAKNKGKRPHAQANNNQQLNKKQNFVKPVTLSLQPSGKKSNKAGKNKKKK